MSTDLNPYAPPQAAVDYVAEATSEAESIRREDIKHEVSIPEVDLAVGLAVLYGPLAVLSIAVGHQIRALRPWARIAAIVLSIIGLLGFPARHAYQRIYLVSLVREEWTAHL